VGPGLVQDARRTCRRIVLEKGTLRPHYLLGQVKPGPDEGAGVRAVPDRPRGSRPPECRRRSTALIQRLLLADLPMRLHARRAAVSRPAQRARRRKEDDQSPVPRRVLSRGQYAHRDGACADREYFAKPRLPEHLEVLWGLGLTK